MILGDSPFEENAKTSCAKFKGEWKDDLFDGNENEFELGIFTNKQLEEVIYPFGSDARWESWKDRQNARELEQKMLQTEIIASKTGMYMPIED